MMGPGGHDTGTVNPAHLTAPLGNKNMTGTTTYLTEEDIKKLIQEHYGGSDTVGKGTKIKVSNALRVSTWISSSAIRTHHGSRSTFAR